MCVYIVYIIPTIILFSDPGNSVKYITVPPDLVATTTEDDNKFTRKIVKTYSHLPDFCP